MTDLEINIEIAKRRVDEAEKRLLEHPTPKNAMDYATRKRALKRMMNSLNGGINNAG